MKVEELPLHDSAKQVLIQLGLTELYPPQEEAVHAGALNGKNLVLASPTASGKTLVAELCALKHILENDGKVLYLSPLRALASEKYEEFQKYTSIRKPNGRKISIGISTGDFDGSDPWMGKHDVIITTNEKADSLLRHRTKWVNDITLVVADEVHLLNDASRGPTLEVVLARLMQVNPDVQLLVLSATIKNVGEVADWLKAISVTTEWRPVTLREGVIIGDEIHFKDGGAQKIDNSAKNPTLNLAVYTVKSGNQALAFAGTRRNSISLAKKIATKIKPQLSKPMKRSLNQLAEQILATGERTRLGEQLAEVVRGGAAFHHAGLSGGHRKIIENSFKEGKIKVLTATPTLAIGMNLPARVVIINEYRRYEPGYGYYPIPVLEYKQMAGRAGRPRYDKFGDSILVAKTEDERDYLMENYILAETEQIWSKLAVEKILRSHVLATIASDFAHSEQGIYEFFGKTFYAHQYDPRAIKGVIQKSLGFLFTEKMIELDKNNILATPFGRRVSELYIDPLTGVTIRDALTNRADNVTDVSFLHMISRTPDMYPKLRPYNTEMDNLQFFIEDHQSEFMFDLPDPWMDRIGFEEFLGEAKMALVLDSWMNETTEDQMIEQFKVQPGDLYRLISNAKWLVHASHELASLFKHKDLLQKLSRLTVRIEKGVKPELLSLVSLQGVGRARARVLFDSGVKTIDDIKTVPLSKLVGLPLIGAKVAQKIKKQVGGIVEMHETQSLDPKKQAKKQRSLTDF
ncbi:MAG: DEAD/DEAH box helicase [Candidatus Bathyarchaeota archaeon]|nr:MAG: DEAD/DEAH box helicase [Candidatus Bathyarchaeota archaeon]